MDNLLMFVLRGGLYLGHLTAQEISDLVTKSVDEGVNYVAQNN